MLSLPQTFLRTAQLPPVPSRDLVFKGVSSNTNNEDTSTFSGIDIGTPHPRRVVVVAVYQGIDNPCTVTVNGFHAVERAGAAAHEFSVHACVVPIGTTADIVVSATSSARKAIGVYVCYPATWCRADAGTATANTTTNAVISDLKVIAGGWVIYAGGQTATLGTFTTTWNGIDAVVEDADAQLEATGSYTFGHIVVTESTDLSDLTLAESTSGTKRLAALSIGPPPP